MACGQPLLRARIRRLAGPLRANEICRPLLTIALRAYIMDDAHPVMRIVCFVFEERTLPMAPKNKFTRQEMVAVLILR